MNHPEPHHLAPAIHRVPLDKLTIFEITESELRDLERGSLESIFLNLGIGVLSTAISFSITLTTTKIESIYTFCIFVVVTVVGYLAGLTFALLWWRARSSIFTVAHEIRARRVPQGTQV